MKPYYLLASFIFCVSLIGALTKKNLISIIICVEAMLASVALFFVLFSKVNGNIDAQIQVFFMVIVAAAEAAIGITIILSMFKKIGSTETADILIESE